MLEHVERQYRGEREAIILAEELQAQLLIDAQRGREVATALGLAVLGSLRILGEAKRRGFIAAVRPLIEELLASDPKFQALVKKSKAGPRKPFAAGSSGLTNG